MTLVARLIAVLGTVALLASGPLPATAQQVTLRVHQFLPARAPVPSNFIAPWAKKVEADSKGRIKVELYPSMQLGGTPPQLFDQVKDGVVDVVWTLPGYTPGRFPRSEAFELPFIAGNGEQTSQAAWEYYQKHLKDELKDVHIIAVHTHGPGLLHVKGNGVRKLEDMKGLKLRGPSRQVNKLLETLGATPVGMPVPAMPDALSKGVIDGTVVPWEVTLPLRVAELVNILRAQRIEIGVVGGQRRVPASALGGKCLQRPTVEPRGRDRAIHALVVRPRFAAQPDHRHPVAGGAGLGRVGRKQINQDVGIEKPISHADLLPAGQSGSPQAGAPGTFSDGQELHVRQVF